MYIDSVFFVFLLHEFFQEEQILCIIEQELIIHPSLFSKDTPFLCIRLLFNVIY